jgi:hypothetical protein
MGRLLLLFFFKRLKTLLLSSISLSNIVPRLSTAPSYLLSNNLWLCIRVGSQIPSWKPPVILLVIGDFFFIDYIFLIFFHFFIIKYLEFLKTQMITR